MQTTISLLLLIGFCCSISSEIPHSFEKNIGEECFNYQKNKTGICRLLNDCPEEKQREEDDLKDNCGFKFHVSVVCCPKTRICNRKCEEYSKPVKETINISIPLTGRLKTVIETTCFIEPTFLSFPTGGEDAKSGEFPHMAILGFGEGNDITWGCGGSLISDQYILTAAHCMSRKSITLGPYVNVTKARLGDLTLINNNSQYTQEFEIIQRIPHPNYNRRIKYHDIALVKLSSKVTFNKWVRPACLHTGEPLRKINAAYIVTGWGKLNYSSYELSKFMRKVVVVLFSNEECNELYEGHLSTKMNDGILDDRMICAAGRTAGRDTCPGDSGGPLQLKHPSTTCMYSIFGVTSFGQYYCGVAGIPTIYTRVSHYIDWIESVVWTHT